MDKFGCWDILVDLIGDSGGLKDGLFGLGSIISYMFTAYQLKSFLLITLFRIIPSIDET